MAVEVEVEVEVVDSRNTCSELNHRENTMDMQNTSALPDANGSERAMKESIQAMVSTPRNSMPAKTRGLRLMLITELGGR
ncbi:hypothetical protein ABQV74_03925, partial [Xanthomonas hortorum pv. pelargonii]